MPERRPSIRPRIVEVEKRPDGAVEKKELAPLEKDELYVKSYDKFFEAVFSGKISNKRVMSGYAAGRWQGAYLVDEDDQDVKDDAGASIVDYDANLRSLRFPEGLIPLWGEFAEKSADYRVERSRALLAVGGIAVVGSLIGRNYATMTQQEVEQRLLGRWQGAYLVDEQGEDVRNDLGESVTDYSDANRAKKNSDPEVVTLLCTALRSLKLAGERKRQVISEGVAQDRFQKRLADSADTQRIFTARLNGRWQGAYLVDEDDQDVKDDAGASIVDYVAENRVGIVDPALKELLLSASRLVKNPETPNVVRVVLQGYFKTGDARSLQRIAEESLAAGDGGAYLKDISDVVKGLEQRKRQNEFERNFFEVNESSGSFERSVALLQSYDARDDADRAIVARLTGLTFERRRLEVAVAFATKVESASGNYDSALQLLGELARSPSTQDKTLVPVLARQLYALEIADFKEKAIKKLTRDARTEEVFSFIESLPQRPAIDGFDYIEAAQDVRKFATRILAEHEKADRLKRVIEVRRSFENGDPKEVLRSIESLPSETAEEIDTVQLLINDFRSYCAANRSDVFDGQFSQALALKMQLSLLEKFIRPELGKNKEAFNYTRRRFVESIYPLVEVLRDDPRTSESMLEVLGTGKPGKENPRMQYVQRLRKLEQQRPLTDIERMYIQSVELMSLYNPYLVAVALAEPGVTQEFLRHHFERKSEQSLSMLKDGDFVPMIHIGTGPSGLAAMGEVVRNNPQLAEQTLVVDEGDAIGGPFAIPRGPAWELNSANRRGSPGVFMPDVPKDELKTVRAYGSPVSRWFPGERAAGNAVRAGSINTTVDYYLAPDDLSTARYPTNEELQLTLSLQAAMLVDRLALGTKYLRQYPAPDDGQPGTKVVELEIANIDGTRRRLDLRTDAVIGSTGLGEPTFGFELKGSRAEKLLEDAKESKGFPVLSTTLDAFRALADRKEKKQSPGKTLIIYGKGNSTDVIIEFISNIFQGDNPLVRDVTKIYVVADGELSARPRYAQITDLKPRNGRGNLIEFINARIGDVDYASPDSKEVCVFDEKKQVIRDAEGRPIVGDAVIGATGFRPQLDQVFSAYLKPGQSFRAPDGKDSPVEPVTLPTNPDVAVADRLKGDPTTLFVGTASKPRFQGYVSKLAQLPKEARDALLRNGAENAVAIGFRAPDTQAAVNIFINSLDIELPLAEKRERRTVSAEGSFEDAGSGEVSCRVDPDRLMIADNVSSESLLLSTVFAYEVGNEIQVTRTTEEGDRPFDGQLQFEVRFDAEAKTFSYQYTSGDAPTVSRAVEQAVARAVSDPDFQRYAISALRKRRRSPKLEMNLAFKNGLVSPRETYVQEA